ncbi:hypothetical protein NEMBOFW57_006048 [Staphylotrichum longicolle]|uniref:RAD52 homolog n=1 Tax=Staphylotrichum longicolle TaxID=669026 RepID=A0AAD4F2L3_9PEZI|nr:hypothetical protein NEMBOFW57_006048 [Staphylotrichum longicolle]
MPAPGDQHTAVANPFEEPQQRISEYTAQEIATLQARLEKQLGPEYISSRSGPGGSKVAYISADKCIGLANEVFGFNGWSSSLQNIQVDFVDKQDGKWHVGLSVIVRVTLRDGTYHEDIGYGQMENTKKAAAFEKAKKEGTTDALKRALRNFGNVLGNCLYDKTYLSNVAKVKAVPTKFDETRLHRHPDLAAHLAKEQKTVPPRPPPQLLAADSFEDFYGDLDEAELDYAEFDDEIVLPPSNETDSKQSNTSNKIQNLPNGGKDIVQPPRQFARASSAGVYPKPGHVFNPRFEGASIPRTPGVDHSASKPLAKSGKHVAPVGVKEDEEEFF